MEELPEDIMSDEDTISDYEADDDSDDLTPEEVEALREDLKDENWETTKLPDKS